MPPYCDREGGYVCNVAITRYAVATLTASRGGAAAELDSSGTEAAPAGVGTLQRDPLVDAVLRHARVRDVDASLTNDFPMGAGLGGSSAASAALFGAVHSWRREPWILSDVAEAGRRVEVEQMGIAGGRQDHYAATFGGALGIEFGADASGAAGVTVQRLAVQERTLRELASRSLLVYTGESRISGDTITAVLNAYAARNVTVLAALERMKALARQMAVALESGDLDGVGRMIGEHWAHQRSLHTAIPTDRIDAIVERSRAAGALGAKAMGASGGGCVLVICAGEGVERARAAIEKLGTVLPFEVDTDGLREL